MDVYLSLSAGVQRSREGYLGSRFLSNAFVERGHNLRVVFPTDIYEKKGIISFKREFVFDGTDFQQENVSEITEGDLFFVYSLGEEGGFNASGKFMDLLYPLESQFGIMLNSAKSTSYEYKPKQKSLDLPWIPGFDVHSRQDLTDLLDSGEKLIAKPSIGLRGEGVLFLGQSSDVTKIPEYLIGNYFFEKFVHSREERRYIFLDGQLIIRRKVRKEGLPGKESFAAVDLMEGNPREIEIAKRAVKETGMFYCGIDFRGDYLLEINGSGTGVAPPTIGNEMDSYNLSSPIVQATERKLGNEK